MEDEQEAEKTSSNVFLFLLPFFLPPSFPPPNMVSKLKSMAAPHRRGGPAGFRRQGTRPALCGRSLSGIASAVPWLYLGGILARTRKPAVAWRGQPWGTQAGGGAVAKGWSEPVLPAQIPLRLPLREHRLPTPHHPGLTHRPR